MALPELVNERFDWYALRTHRGKGEPERVLTRADELSDFRQRWPFAREEEFRDDSGELREGFYPVYEAILRENGKVLLVSIYEYDSNERGEGFGFLINDLTGPLSALCDKMVVVLHDTPENPEIVLAEIQELEESLPLKEIRPVVTAFTQKNKNGLDTGAEITECFEQWSATRVFQSFNHLYMWFKNEDGD